MPTYKAKKVKLVNAAPGSKRRPPKVQQAQVVFVPETVDGSGQMLVAKVLQPQPQSKYKIDPKAVRLISAEGVEETKPITFRHPETGEMITVNVKTDAAVSEMPHADAAFLSRLIKEYGEKKKTEAQQPAGPKKRGRKPFTEKHQMVSISLSESMLACANLAKILHKNSLTQYVRDLIAQDWELNKDTYTAAAAEKLATLTKK